MRRSLSIAAKLSLLIAAAVFVTALAVNDVYMRGSRNILIDRAADELRQQTDFFRYPLANDFRLIEEDGRLLSGLRALGGTGKDVISIDALADFFTEMLRTTPHYLSIALLAPDGTGKLIVRRSGKNFERGTSADMAMELAHSATTVSLASGDTYFSDLHLLMQNGRVAEPRMLLLETLTPVFNEKGERNGFIFIETDFGIILHDIRQKLSASNNFYVTDANGDYLAGPDHEALYASDLNHNIRIQQAYPGLTAVMQNVQADDVVLMPKDGAGEHVLAFRKFHFDPRNADRYLGIAVEAPYKGIVEHINSAEQRGYIVSFAIALAALAAAILFLRLSLNPLRRIADMVVLYRQGEKLIDLPVQSPDEIGTLAREFEVMMRQKNAEDWVRENLVGITKKLLGFKDIKSFAAALMEAAAPAVNAHFGVLYANRLFLHGSHEEGVEELALLGSYAYLERAGFPARFALGEGLVGQCAQNRQPMLVSDIPPNYLRVASAIGEANPRQILLLPITFETRLVGVMELATLGSFEDTHITFLQQLCFNIGVILNGIGAGMRTEELLEETRMANEELQRSEEELKAQQEELESSNEEMEEQTKTLEEQNEQIRKQSTELEETNRIMREKAEELERASRYKSEFLANMSHELRTPLNSLLILARSLASNEDGNLTAEQVEEANIIHGGGLELLNLINDILDLSKVEAGKIHVARETVPLDGIVKRMEKQFAPMAADKKIAFHIRTQGGLPVTIFTDTQRVEQILKNLLSNAFKFTERGSITLDVRKPVAALDNARGSSIADSIAFSVIDTGIGIEENKFREIFEAFQQEDGSTDRHYGGTGLGLTIARKLARLLGGEIHVQSRKGSGSTFTLLLPLAYTDEAPTEITEPPVSAPTPELMRQPATKSILIIEDDQNFVLALTRLAEKRGFSCVVAPNGATGLALASQSSISAIILDMRLPDMTGLEVLEKLKADSKTRALPVHVITAYGEDGGAVPLQRGAAGYLTKPLTQNDIDDIFARIESLRTARTKQLLAVEDDRATQAAICSLLRKGDIAITMAETGEQALQEIRRRPFDCVILDLRLPDMTGYQWLERMEHAVGDRTPPVVVYTAQEITEEENRRLQSYTGSIVIKGASSAERLLDEVTLFLHSIENTTAQAPVIRMKHDPEAAFTGRKILLVDDDLRNTFALSKILRKHGLTVVIADNGELALEKLQTEKGVDLVIMDIMMPVMDGYQAIRAMRAQPAFAQLPIIALTARAMPEEQQKCMAAGANDYLTKPVDIEKLVALLRLWLFKQEKIA